jgi:hypothetical protein
MMNVTGKKNVIFGVLVIINVYAPTEEESNDDWKYDITHENSHRYQC